MNRWRAMVLAALTAALPILAGDLHGWLLTVLAIAAGSVAALTLPFKNLSKCNVAVEYRTP